MARVSVDKVWLVEGPRPSLDAAIDRAIHEHGMSATRVAGRIEMRGGSQLKMRTMGGLFTKDSVLPRAGTLERRPEPDTPGVERISIHLEDKMGFGVMDATMKQKYERILGSVAFSIEAAVTENAAVFRAADEPDADGPAAATPASAQPSALVSVSDELEKLAALHERGVLSAAEFEAAKRQASRLTARRSRCAASSGAGLSDRKCVVGVASGVPVASRHCAIDARS